MSLAEKTLANSYVDLLQMNNSNNGIDSTTRNVKDGEGTGSSLWLGDDATLVQPQNDDATNTFYVKDSGGTTLFNVNASTSEVSAVGNTLNTQYATFGVAIADSSSFTVNTHTALPFQLGGGNPIYPPLFGTGTDPATTFTTAEGNNTRASALVPCLWRVPDAMSIDAVTSVEGADTATGDTTRMHLFSYSFSSGATSCLTSGTLLAHNSDVTNAGSEQPYLSTWTVDSAAVTAGKVILAFFRSDSINSDYAVNITVKYHLT